jgi:hypothetical protein
MKNGRGETVIADTTVSALEIRNGWRRKSPLHEKSFGSIDTMWADCEGKPSLGLGLPSSKRAEWKQY